MQKVAPYAGAWIETEFFSYLCNANLSLPTRERGLKRFLRQGAAKI